MAMVVVTAPSGSAIDDSDGRPSFSALSVSHFMASTVVLSAPTPLWLSADWIRRGTASSSGSLRNSRTSSSRLTPLQRPSEHSIITSPAFSGKAAWISTGGMNGEPRQLSTLLRSGCTSASASVISPRLIRLCTLEWSSVRNRMSESRSRYSRESPACPHHACPSCTTQATMVVRGHSFMPCSSR